MSLIKYTIQTYFRLVRILDTYYNAIFMNNFTAVRITPLLNEFFLAELEISKSGSQEMKKR